LVAKVTDKIGREGKDVKSTFSTVLKVAHGAIQGCPVDVKHGAKCTTGKVGGKTKTQKGEL